MFHKQIVIPWLDRSQCGDFNCAYVFVKMLTEDKLWGIKIFDAIFQIVRSLAFRK